MEEGIERYMEAESFMRDERGVGIESSQVGINT
jgi:hypothetical protein